MAERTYQNSDNPTDLEKKHVPIMEIIGDLKFGSKVTIKIKVGEEPHVMEEDHYITFIALKKDDEIIGTQELKPGDAPAAEFQLKLNKDCTLRAIEECNIHGVWYFNQKIELSQE